MSIDRQEFSARFCTFSNFLHLIVLPIFCTFRVSKIALEIMPKFFKLPKIFENHSSGLFKDDFCNLQNLLIICELILT